MNYKIRIFFTLFFLAILSCPLAEIVQEAVASQKSGIYSAYIDEMITRCETKEWISDSSAIQAESALYILKGSFLKANKSDLVQDMIVEGVGIEPYQMDYYLNGRFFELLRKWEGNREQNAP
jgi:hypothetical protein